MPKGLQFKKIKKASTFLVPLLQDFSVQGQDLVEDFSVQGQNGCWKGSGHKISPSPSDLRSQPSCFTSHLSSLKQCLGDSETQGATRSFLLMFFNKIEGEKRFTGDNPFSGNYSCWCTAGPGALRSESGASPDAP